MSIIDTISNRYSQRSYNPHKSVPKEILEKIAQSGVMAPSAANKQPWEILIISDPQLKAKIHKSYEKNWFAQAPHILVVKGSLNNCWKRREDGYLSLETDLTICMDHMILTAYELKVGTCWIAAFNPEILSKALNLKDNERVYAITPLGYAIEESPQPKKRKSFNEVVHFI